MIVETLKLASSALWVNKLRTGLTLLGLMIGIASVIGIISLLEGMMTRINRLFEEQGTTTIFVTRFGIITSEDEFLRAIKRKKLTIADAKAIEKGCPLAEEVGLEVSDNLTVKAGSEVPTAGAGSPGSSSTSWLPLWRTWYSAHQRPLRGS